MDPKMISQWFEMAQTLGIGATFVLGIICWLMWLRLCDEQNYSRKRDAETFQVLQNLAANLQDSKAANAQNSERTMMAITTLQTTLASKIDQFAGHR